jgi:hypothetical protein
MSILKQKSLETNIFIFKKVLKNYLKNVDLETSLLFSYMSYMYLRSWLDVII